MIRYGSFAYFFYIFLALGVTASFYLLLKRRAVQVQKTVVFLLALINVLQHVFKPYVWPHLWGEALGYSSTVYNMCAFLILASPLVLLSENQTAKQFITFIGGAAGLFPLFMPHWLIGKSAFAWDVIRFYFCHSLLFITSVLPAFFKFYPLDYRTFWKIPFLYFFGMAIIIFNDVIVVSQGLVGDKSDLYGTLSSLNPANIMHAPDGFPFVKTVCAALSPAAFSDAPFLWQAIPMYLLIAVSSFVVGAVFDRRRLKTDFRRLQKSRKMKNDGIEFRR